MELVWLASMVEEAENLNGLGEVVHIQWRVSCWNQAPGAELTCGWPTNTPLMFSSPPFQPGVPNLSRSGPKGCVFQSVGFLRGGTQPSNVAKDGQPAESPTSRKSGETLRLRSGQAMGRPGKHFHVPTGWRTGVSAPHEHGHANSAGRTLATKSTRKCPNMLATRSRRH
jgi:hypothetical protein